MSALVPVSLIHYRSHVNGHSTRSAFVCSIYPQLLFLPDFNLYSSLFLALSGGLQVMVAVFHRHSNCGPFSLGAAWTCSLSVSDPCGGKGALCPEFSFCGRAIICCTCHISALFSWMEK